MNKNLKTAFVYSNLPSAAHFYSTDWPSGRGVGAGGAEGESVPPKVLICQNFGQNIQTFGQRSFEIF